jgi:hypothetical protein
MLRKNNGESTFGLILILLIVAAGIYVGFKWGYAAWDAGTFREDVNKSLGYWKAHGAPAPENMRLEILGKAQKIGIELYEEDIEIELQDKYLSLDIYWEMPLSFPGGYTYYLPYSIERELQVQ